MPFAVAAAGVSAAGALIGSQMQSNAIKSGQNAANAAAAQGLATATNALSPWSTAGQAALGPIGGIAGPTPQTIGGATDVGGELSGIYGPDAASSAMAGFQTSPGYQFALQQGERGVDASAAAAGMLRSGATLKAENTYAQGIADQQFNTYETNANTAFGNYYNKLAALSGQGLTAANDLAGAATGTAKDISGTDTGAAAAQSGIIGNEASSLGTTANKLFSNQAFTNSISGGSPQAFDPANFGAASFDL